MIVAKLIGGRGNQLFQYAIARHLAHINNTDILIDISEFETYKLHSYALSHLNIVEKIATKRDIELLVKVKEKHFHFDPCFKKFGDNILMQGYWQSEKYFCEIKHILDNEFSVKYPLSDKNLEIYKLIIGSNSVSIHVRRSDYLPNSHSDQIFDNLNLTYYNSAIQIFANELEKPCFFVFSDDPEWVKSNLKINFPHIYVDHNTAITAYEDMRLMSLCKHNIIANSSFSWWGAWLNRNEEKKVIAPIKWFNNNVRNIDCRDIIPKTWVRI